MTAEGCVLISKPAIGALFVPLLIAVQAFAQVGEDPAQLTVISGATLGFRAEAEKSFVDFPFVLNRFEFRFLSDSAHQLVGGAGITVTVFDTLGLPVDSSSINLVFHAGDSAETHRADIRLCGSVTVDLPAGRYTARMEAIDMVSKKSGERFYRSIVVPKWTKETFAIGRALSAWQISEPVDDSLEDRAVAGNFRNGFTVLANPLGLYGKSDSLLFVYAEVYGLGSDSSEFTFRGVLVDSSGNRREVVSSRQKKPGGTAIIATSLSMADWGFGAHTLWLTAFDPGRGLSASTHLNVYRVKGRAAEAAELSAATFQGDPYDTMSAVDRMHMSYHYLTPAQRQLVASLSDSARSRYLDQFWKAQDETPATEANETRREVISRYLYANAHFSTTPSKDDGWRTDRGRVYIKMGEPEKIDRDMFPEVEWPYEVWFYYSRRKNPLYVFQDTRNNSEFKIVHSNADGEIYSAQWADRLRRHEGNQTSAKSR